MSRLEELIQELCPNGVEYKKIEEFIDYIQPTKYIVSDTKYDDSYDVPVLTAGQSFVLGYTNETNGIYQANKDSPVIIFDDFTAGFHWVDFSFKVKSSAMKILVPKGGINFRFFYHLMGMINYKPKEHIRLWIGTYSQIKIPIPPLEVQKEIVRVLDNFTELTEELTKELTKELTARKKQYDYYRDILLESNKLKKIKLKDLFDIKTGYTPSKAKSEYWEHGTLPWFRLEDINDKGRILYDSYQHITPKALKGNGLFRENSVIISTSATIGEYALIKVPFLCNQRFTCLTVKDKYKREYNIEFLNHYCPMLSKYCKEHLNKGNFASVDMTKFGNFEFPIISLEEQQRIVNILDKFDAYCNDLTQGLQAEIELRKQQYEYYRDKLLTFKELK